MKTDPVLITATSDGTLSYWNTKKNIWLEEDILEPSSEYSINKLALSLDKLKLAAACSDGVKLFDIKAQKPIFKLRKAVEEKSNVVSVGFDSQSQWIYYSTEGGTLNTLDIRDGKQNTVFKQKNDITSSILNPNQDEIIFGDSDGYIKVFDLKKNLSEASLSVNKGVGIRSLAFSSDATLLAVASSDGQLRTLSLSKTYIQTETNIQHVHDDYILNVKISKDKNFLVTSSADKTIKIFEIKDFKIKQKHILYGHTQWVWDISILSNSKFLLSVSTDGYLKLWNLLTGKCVKEFFNSNLESIETQKYF